MIHFWECAIRRTRKQSENFKIFWESQKIFYKDYHPVDLRQALFGGRVEGKITAGCWWA